MFEIGNYIIANNDDIYCITNTEVLCVVESTDNDGILNIKIVGVCGRSRLSSLETSHNVESKHFQEITAEDFLHIYPDAIFHDSVSVKKEQKDTDYDEFMDLPEIESDNTITISDTHKKELHLQISSLLTTYGYKYKDEFISKILDEWACKKSSLINLMQKHPNYNGNYQIVFDYDYNREFNNEIVSDFLFYITNRSVIILGMTPINFLWSANELRDIINRCEKAKSISNYYEEFFGNDRLLIDGKSISEWKETYKKFKPIYEGLIEYKNKLYERCEYYSRYEKLNKLSGLIEINKDKHTISEEEAKRLNDHFENIRFSKGQKISKVINKICVYYGINRHESYNKKFAEFSDAINPLSIKRHTIISAHPIDYFTMSFGNSWSSCHTIDKSNRRNAPNGYEGRYSSGTESYLLDNSSVILYTVNRDFNGNHYELEPKVQRNMFHIGKRKIIQGRVYPQSSDETTNIYETFRNIMQKIISECLNVPNVWFLRRTGSNTCKYIISKGTHYHDYSSFSSCNVSFLKPLSNSLDDCISVGHNPICPMCGEEHGNESNIMCAECAGEYYDK